MKLNDLLQGAVNLFGAETSGKVALQPVSDIAVSVDKTSFSRAISNIIINALQAKKEGQQDLEVLITAVEKDGVVLVSIRDNGKGMTDEVREKVFQPQFTTKHSGSGLGLALTQQIVRQAGGRIWFESVVDRGTVFYIELPTLK